MNPVWKMKREEIKELQQNKLKLLGVENLSLCPFTTAEDIINRPQSFLRVSQSDVQRIITERSSGTTGTAKRIFYTKRDCENTVELFADGLRKLVFPGEKTMVCMPFSGPFGLGELISEAIESLHAVPLKIGIGKTYYSLMRVIREEKPETFVGFPQTLLALQRLCDGKAFRRALISGDYCIKADYGIPVFPHYGSREMGLGGAITCEAHSGMHLREDHVIAEIIDEDGNAVPDGEEGELVITTIGMEAMPLIRYRTGDYTRIIPGLCSCGNETVRLGDVRRKNEIERLDDEMFKEPGLIDWRGERRIYIRDVDENTRPLFPAKRTIM